MEKITNFVITNAEGADIEYILIDRGNGEFTSMPKSVYDEQQAALNEGLAK